MTQPEASRARVWVVDDDRSVRFVLAEALREAGFAVQSFDSAQAALAALDAGTPPQLVFTDVRMPGMDGLGFLDALKARDHELPVIVMSAWTDIASTAGAFRGGAHEFLSKPFDLDEAVALARRALPSAAIPDGDAVSRAIDVPPPGIESDPALLGDAPAMRDLFRAIGRLAQAPLSVLVTGETGTGKELVARALHRESPRAKRPFIALNTAAIPAELLESELFGHEAGAFTGATRRHGGRFEQADGGTLFLDEIGDMPSPLQTRLLRVLAEGEFFRVGGRELLRVDVRVIAATHQDLEALVADGRFRADLLHRLDVVRLRLPPLRERKGDVGMLAQSFLGNAAKRFQAPRKKLTSEALHLLEAHPWPGNVRELENLCWRLAALAPGQSIRSGDVRASLRASPNPIARQDGRGADGLGPDPVALDWTRPLTAWARTALSGGESAIHARAKQQFEQALLAAALEHTGGHRQQAAELLGLGRNTLTRKLGRKHDAAAE